jgi:hypothetical protein
MLRIPLTTSEEQYARLEALQSAFAEVCNALGLVVQRTRVWNRVALHHMAYKELRERFPALGSQMVCNAIYSVSRACRLVFQTPESPLHLSKLGTRTLPLLMFTRDCPVFFDRHTLSLKSGQVSMFTLDGRMRFQLSLRPEDEYTFHTCKVLEIVLQRRTGCFELSFVFELDDRGAHGDSEGPQMNKAETCSGQDTTPFAPKLSVIPAYVRVEEVA